VIEGRTQGVNSNEKTGTRPDNSETLPQMSILPSVFSWQISFDCSGFLDSRPPETTPEAASTIKTATHGFSIVTAADGERAVQFIKTLDDGTTVTFQLCEGARGTSRSDTSRSDLAQYGNEKLKGATLRTHSEFVEMVDELFKAVKGLMVENSELQTEDKALKLAFKIVQEGVRREGGGSWVVFDTVDKDGGRAVSGRQVSVLVFRRVNDHRNCCAFFRVSSPESKN
jgi:hypothetical protein